MSTAAIIPVKGRYPLLIWTVDRLKTINKIDHIILVGHEDEGKDLARVMEVDWVYHPNEPLGAKWNSGWEFALKAYDPDYYLFVGSSDWISENWMDEMIPHLDEYDMVGRPDMFLLDIGALGNRVCYWPGYNDSRQGEPIGIGRVLKRSIVHKMAGKPFNGVWDKSLDFSMMLHLESFNGKIKLICDNNTSSLSISCYKWGNKHNFQDHWRGWGNSKRMNDGKDFLQQYYPQALEMTL